MIEIFEALVNILEAEEVHPDLDLDKVKEGRRIAENRVKNLIKTLDSVTRPDSGKNFDVVVLGGFHLVAKIIKELKSHMILYKFKCSHWWKIALQSECCNFNQ